MTGCVRAPHVENRERPVEAGLPVPFFSDEALTWDFGDGSPTVDAAQPTHTFNAAGRYTVRGFAGKQLREQISLTVSPRAALHLVPPDVELAVVLRDLSELGPLVDFSEAVLGVSAVQHALDVQPLLAWAVDQAVAGNGGVDPREGGALFRWPGTEDVVVTVVGVVDSEAAQAGFSSALGSFGWERVSTVLGLTRFEREGRALDVFADRGALYAVETSITGRFPSAQARIGSMSERGLETRPELESLLDGLPAGGVVLFGRAPDDSRWTMGAAAVRLTADTLRLEGSLLSAQPLWPVPAAPASRLLSKAPAGPVAIVSAMVSAESLLSTTLGPRRRDRLTRELAEKGVDLQRLLAGLTGGADAVVYADVEGFVRDTLAAGGKPQPRATWLVEAPVTEASVFAPALDAWLRAHLDGLVTEREAQLQLWRGRWNELSTDVVLTPRALFIKGGAAVDERAPTDLLTPLLSDYDGAFGPGHVSVLVDLGRLREELLTPRLMDIDPRKAITAQAAAVTVLDRLTRLDSVMVDVVAAPAGANVQLVLRLRSPQQ